MLRDLFIIPNIFMFKIDILQVINPNPSQKNPNNNQYNDYYSPFLYEKDEHSLNKPPPV